MRYHRQEEKAGRKIHQKHLQEETVNLGFATQKHQLRALRQLKILFQKKKKRQKKRRHTALQKRTIFGIKEFNISIFYAISKIISSVQIHISQPFKTDSTNNEHFVFLHFLFFTNRTTLLYIFFYISYFSFLISAALTCIVLM